MIAIEMNGVLFDDTKRIHLKNEGEWNAYHAAIENDMPLPFGRLLFDNFVKMDCAVAVICDEPEDLRQTVKSFLAKHEMSPDKLIMRPNNSYLTTPVLRVRQLRKIEQTTIVIIRSNDKLAAALSEAGFCVLEQVGINSLSKGE